MKQYIDKSALVAEIERKIHNIDYEGISDRNIGQKQSLYHILSFLDTLEVKEVEDNKCSDCINDKGCINCENGNMYEKVNSALEDCKCKFEGKVRKLWEEINTGHEYSVIYSYDTFYGLCLDIADWQKENLWKPAEGNDLPEIDKPAIVLTQPYPLEGNEYAVGFSHRVVEGEFATKDGIHFSIESYGKGGWNIPNVVWWLDCPMPYKEGGEE